MSRRLQKSLEEYLRINPSRKQVAQLLCKVANNNVLHMKELGLFTELAPQFNLTLDDFYDDQDELDEYAKKYIGLYNWKVKEGVE